MAKTYTVRTVYRAADGNLKESTGRVWYSRLDAEMALTTFRKSIEAKGGTYVKSTMLYNVEIA